MEKDHFVLKSDTGEVIDKVRTSQLETVIPKISSGLVYILTGKHKGKVGKLIEKDNRDEVGVIQIPDEGVVELHFDDICEFVGDIEDYL
jgi:ribosomal protein S4E